MQITEDRIAAAANAIAGDLPDLDYDDRLAVAHRALAAAFAARIDEPRAL